ncbi:helix-turn-helix domain-containing protein [Paenibacillus sp. GCM10012307]|uniref:Helix-turn-helix domain-containing protein n=1 Tax=Paenibacillus roseus TaxID=2798579 RepID=A0A934J412_9BACL|nr:helix-turn-helix transcriptional regulator [Paenibacillus roseus]MBJ6361113.1 helix-turn-helix domain-containing protein [Paenibacillus roseus]
MKLSKDLKIGSNIKKLRKERRIKLVDLANSVGISNSYLSQIENGHKPIPSLKVLEKISLSLHVPFHQFIEEAGGNFSDNSPDDGEAEREHNQEVELSNFLEISDYLRYFPDITCDGVVIPKRIKDQILDFSKYLMTKEKD